MEAAAIGGGEVSWEGATEISASVESKCGEELLWLGPGQVSPGKRSSLHPVLWPVCILSHCLWHHSGLLDSKEPLMVGVGTTPLLSDIPADETHTKEPSVCHQTLTCLLPSPAFCPCRPHPQSCQSQFKTHGVASK